MTEDKKTTYTCSICGKSYEPQRTDLEVQHICYHCREEYGISNNYIYENPSEPAPRETIPSNYSLKNRPTYLRTDFIAIMFALWFLVVPLIIGLICLYLQNKQNNEDQKQIQSALSTQKKYYEIGCDRYEDVTAKIAEMKKNTDDELSTINNLLASKHKELDKLQTTIPDLQNQEEALQKQVNTQKNKIKKIKSLYKSMVYCIENNKRLEKELEEEFMELLVTELLPLHCMDVKSLRKAFRENDKQISKLTEQYSKRYTTKANKSIYSLMTIALRAELQNILYALKYNKLDHAIEEIKALTAKYLSIAGNGNQSIAGTLTTFIGELEYFFIEAVKIEYNYYVKKEQARQEQLAIREQMRQEAEERKALAQEKKKIEQEEEKYQQEIEKLNQQLSSSSAEDLDKLKARILALENQLSDVILKKEEITTLQNGKAGNVYIISNLGSFGENVFKIGMTRRINPQDRINELGSASVPFKFDVHSFIFSDDAVSLENKLHQTLNEKRVNKVNLRKEFFYTSVDELEQLVSEIDPTAEFKRTMLAEEFRQSQDGILYDTAEEYLNDEDLNNEDLVDELESQE